MNQLLLKLIIDGTNAGAIRALAQTEAAGKSLGQTFLQTDKAGGLQNTQAGIAAVEARLKSLQGVGAQALNALGVSLTIRELVQLSDTYSQMIGRLKLATQYTGDFSETFVLLQNSARATRSDLVATVDLYTKMLPALQGIGLGGKQAVGIITTINQAIQLSGASAQAAEAALVQLGQGFGSGVLRGEELNSVLEQTPALAQAIADGLGVPLGELRKLGEEGKLTANLVAGALQKMAAEIDANFSQMPPTVSQAMTGLKNEVLLFVGATDQAAGGSSVLANTINALAQELHEAGPASTALAEGVKILINGFDGLYRIIKIVGLGLAGYAAAAKAALTGDVAGAKAIWNELGRDIDAVLQKQLLTDQKVVQSAVDSGKKRALLEEQLAVQKKRLADLNAYEQGRTSDNIAKKDKENIDARIADQQRLVDAVRKSWQEQLSEAEKFAESAQKRLAKASDIRAAGEQKIFNASISGLSEDDQLAAKQARLNDLQQQGDAAARSARIAALKGDAKLFDKEVENAEKRLQAALDMASEVKDIFAMQSITASLAGLQEAGASMDKKKAAEAKSTADAQAATLNELQAKLEKMKADARAIEVKADITDAETKVKGLQGQLDALKDKTVTVTVNTVNASNAPIATPDGTVSRAYGGPIPGWSPHSRADNILVWATAREFMVQEPTMRQPGALPFMHDFNRDGMKALKRWAPRYAFGGEVGQPSGLMRSPGFGGAGHSSSQTPLVIDLGELGKYRAETSNSTASDLTRAFQMARLSTRRRSRK